jgi:hypothetical protein
MLKFHQMTRQITGWITIGYCRKSPSKETSQKRLELLQEMLNSLHVNNLCEKVFVSPICRADSDLLTRDISLTATAQSISKQLRFQNGDMQGKKKRSTAPDPTINFPLPFFFLSSYRFPYACKNNDFVHSTGCARLRWPL